jgi:hypothetical protein
VNTPRGYVIYVLRTTQPLDVVWETSFRATCGCVMFAALLEHGAFTRCPRMIRQTWRRLFVARSPLGFCPRRYRTERGLDTGLAERATRVTYKSRQRTLSTSWMYATGAPFGSINGA